MFLWIKTNWSSALTSEQEDKLNKVIVKENYANYDEAINEIANYSVDDIIFLKADQGSYDTWDYKQGWYYKKVDSYTIQALDLKDIKNLTKRDVIDNVTSIDLDKPLSANQGKNLNDLITKLYNLEWVNNWDETLWDFNEWIFWSNQTVKALFQQIETLIKNKNVPWQFLWYSDTFDTLPTTDDDWKAANKWDWAILTKTGALWLWKKRGVYVYDWSDYQFAYEVWSEDSMTTIKYATLDDADWKNIANNTFIIIWTNTAVDHLLVNISWSEVVFDKTDLSNLTLIKDNNIITSIQDKIYKHELMRRNQILMSWWWDITWNNNELTISQRIIWIPSWEWQWWHINLDTCDNLSVPNWNIAYLRLTDAEIKTTSRIWKDTADIIVTYYLDYIPNENDLIIWYANWDTWHFIFWNWLSSNLVAKTKVFIQHDTRTWCPATHAADTDINLQTVNITHKSLVRYDVETIWNYTARFDVRLMVDWNKTVWNWSIQHLTSTTNASWKPVSRSWTWILNPWTHTFSYRCDKADVIWCWKNWWLWRVIVTPI